MVVAAPLPASLTLDGVEVPVWSYAVLSNLKRANVKERALNLREAVGAERLPPLEDGSHLVPWLIHAYAAVAAAAGRADLTTAAFGLPDDAEPSEPHFLRPQEQLRMMREGRPIPAANLRPAAARRPASLGPKGAPVASAAEFGWSRPASTARSDFDYDAHRPVVGGVAFADISRRNRAVAGEQKQLATGSVGHFLFGDGAGADDATRAPPKPYAYDPPYGLGGKAAHEMTTTNRSELRCDDPAAFAAVSKANAGIATKQRELGRGTVGDFLFAQGRAEPIVSTRQAQDAATAAAARAEHEAWASFAAAGPIALNRRSSREFFENFL